VAGAGDAVSDLERAANEVGGASVTRYEDAGAARLAFDRNAADAVVVANRNDDGGSQRLSPPRMRQWKPP